MPRYPRYVITHTKIAHVVHENSGNGWGCWWGTVCGKWTHPVTVTDELPEGVRMCKHCQRYVEEEQGNG